jgi:hypothetical protein
MSRRGREIEVEAVAGLAIVIFLIFGTVILALIKVVTVLLLWACLLGIAGLAGYGFYRVIRYKWNRQLNIEAHTPTIDWTFPSIPKVDTAWSDIPYPEFPDKTIRLPAHVIGTSGAWKDVLRMLVDFPAFKAAASPSDLKQRVKAFEAAADGIQGTAIGQAAKTANEQRDHLEAILNQLQNIHQPAEASIRAQLDWAAFNVQQMATDDFWNRQRAKRLCSMLSMNEIRLSQHVRDIKQKAKFQQHCIRDFLDPELRAKRIKDRVGDELRRLNEITTSKEFAGAVTETAVIDELAQLPSHCLVINDLKLQAPRYIHNRGKPIQSAQIDSLVITPAGIFVVEAKNWSRSFAQSGEGFSPYEQVNRARYLVHIILQESGMDHVKVRAIVTAQGSLPEKGEPKVAVKSVKQLRGYITWFEPAGVDVRRAGAELRRLCS